MVPTFFVQARHAHGATSNVKAHGGGVPALGEVFGGIEEASRESSSVMARRDGKVAKVGGVGEPRLGHRGSRREHGDGSDDVRFELGDEDDAGAAFFGDGAEVSFAVVVVDHVGKFPSEGAQEGVDEEVAHEQVFFWTGEADVDVAGHCLLFATGR